MADHKSLLSVVAEQFPELSKEESKELVLKSLNWLTTVGAFAARKLDLVQSDPRQSTLERRAQAIAFSVMLAALNSQEQDSIATITRELESGSVIPLGT